MFNVRQMTDGVCDNVNNETFMNITAAEIEQKLREACPYGVDFSQDVVTGGYFIDLAEADCFQVVAPSGDYSTLLDLKARIEADPDFFEDEEEEGDED